MSVGIAFAACGLPDDLEEDLVGTDWHQRAIDVLFDALMDLAEMERLPWHVGNQLALVGWAPDGSSWRPSPDVMVHPLAGPEPRKEMAARTDGVPVLIVEVASEHTWRHDVNVVAGKAAGYMAMGVSHYLVFDPTRAFLGEACRGWRLDNTRRVPGRVVAWRPDRMGRYRCAPLGIALLAEGSFLRVIDATDTLVPTRTERIYALFERLEQSEALVRQNEQLAGRNEQLAGENEQLAGERAQLAGENEQLAGERAQLAGENEQLAGERAQLADERARLAGTNEQLAGANATLAEHNAGLLEEIARLRTEIARLRGGG